MKKVNLISRLLSYSHEKQTPQMFGRYAVMLLMLFTLGVGQMWADWYLSGPTDFGGYDWGTQSSLKMSSSGISNWVYKSLQPGAEWAGFKITDGSTWYGKNSSNVTVGTEYTPSSSGSADPNYCDFSQYSSMPYYFFFNTSTKKLMIQPNYYLAGDCGATDHSWATDKNTNTYDATNGYFKWNTMSLTAETEYKFKLTNGQGTAWTYTFQDWSGVTATNGTKNTTDGSNNICFEPNHDGVAVIIFKPTDNTMVIHCPYQVSYNKGANGTGSNTSASKTWKTNLTLLGATFTRSGYTQDGWSTSDGGAKVYNLSGSYTADADVTLYPHWSENMSSVTLTASPSGKGSFTIGGAAATSTTAGVTTTRSVTAVPIDGYHFVSWSITGGATISSTTTNPTTVTGGGAGTAATLTATFAADDVYSLTVAAGTGISSVSGSTNDIKAGDKIDIDATVATGYTWSTWTKTGSGTLSTYTAGTKSQKVTVGTAGDITLTASATENMSSLTTSNHYDAGDPKYSVPSKSVSSIGITTTADLTAATPSTGYTFAGWTLSNNLVVTSGDENEDLSITVRTTGNGAAATAQANYNEDVSTDWTLKGSFVDDFATAFDFEKKSGESTGSVAYTTLTLAAGTTYNFKVIKDGSTWYGNSGTMTSANCTNWTFTTGESSNAGITTTSAGTYQFKIDFSGANPSVSVIYPPTLTWSATSVYSGNASTLTASVSNVVSSKTIKYDVYAGATATGDVVATWSGSTSSTTHSRALSVTPSFGASDVNKQYTVKVTYDGTRIATYTAYIGRKWDIYVHDVQSWGQMKLHMWNASGSKSTYPGDPCSLYNSSTSWYTVTLDGKYNSGFVLSADGDDTKTANHSMSISSFGAGSYWYVDKYKGGSLTTVSVSDPTVTLSATVTSTNQINLTGNVSNFGGDGTAASDMKEVYFKVNNTKDAASITVSTSNGNFTKTLNNPTPDNTNNTLQAFAENIHGTGSSSAICFTRVTLDNQSATTAGTANVLAVNGANMASGATAPTKWGYNFGGYYASTGGSGKQYYNSSMGSANTWDQTNATKTIYAKWTAKSCTITLNNQSATSAGTTSVSTTYNTNTNLTSSITCPTKTGYIFGGYYTATNGKGSQIIARNGSWNANVDTYMYSGNWVYDGGTTLYAWWIECAGYSFHYGTTDADDWAKTCFTQDGSTSTWNIENFAIPNKPNFFVGYQEEFYASGLGTGDTKSKSVERAWTDTYSEVSSTGQGQMKLLPGGYTVGQATGALGTITIDTDSKDYNLSVGFTPNGYGVTHNSGTHEFVTASSNWRETEVVTLTSGDVSGNFQVKLKTSSSWAATAHGVAENASAVNGRKITGDSNIANGLKGVFQMWTDAAANNFGLCFVTVHDVTFDMQGHGEAISKYTDVRYNSKISAPSAPSQTGYTFGGWYKEEGCTNAWNFASDVVTAATTLYAKWTANEYAITLDLQTSDDGYGSGGDDDLTATFDDAFPSATMPTAANGWAFMGYWSAAGGEGTQFTNEDGTLLANIDDYSDASGHWIYDGTKTLYAYYKKAEITSVTFDNAIVEPNATITATANISPTPTGTTTVCWRLLHDNGNEYTPQPTFTPASGATVSFTVPETSTYYKVEAKLRTGNDCSGGTLLDTKIGRFQVAGSHTVTVYYKHSTNVIKASTSVTANPLDWSEEITAPDIFGYTFSSWTAADGVTIKNGDSDPVTSSTNATIQIEATYNGSLTANYTPKNIIYFKDNLEWTDPEDASAHIYLNLLTGDYWNTDNGTGNEGVTDRNLQMDRVPGTTDIFYYDYGNKTTSNYVSFTKESMNGYTHFYQSSGKAHVVFPSRALDALGTNNATGLGFYAATPMFVPLATQNPVQKNSNHAEYYNDGYWTKYLPGTGYSLDIYQSDGSTRVNTIAFTSADELMPMKVTMDLEGSHTYKFQLKRDGDVYYGNSGTMTYEDHGQNTAWDFYNNSPFNMCTIVTNAAGNYTFNLSYSPNSEGTQNRLRMSVDYPVANGDYRLVYSDAVQTKPLTSAIVNKENNGTAIVSFFVRPGSTPVLRIQQASIVGSTVTWNEYPDAESETNQITGTIASAITKDTVYNFNLSMNGSGALTVASAEYYSGNYYIRTDAANSKWDNYRTDPDHLMTYSEYSVDHGGYSHYYVHWVDKDDVGRKNVKFVIANDYSPNISDTLARETASGTWENIDKFIDAGGDLKRSANVRFMWDIATNTISRAYVDGAQGDYSSNFLYMLNVEAGDDKIKTKDATALTDHKVTFKDNGNWMYEANVKAQPTAQIKLLSNWGTENTITQYFRGASDATETLLGGSGSTWYDIRIIYDFKTNRLIAGLIPSGNISDPMAIHADVMFVREHHGDIAQLTFTDDGALTDIETAFGVLQLNKWTINNKSKADGHAPLSPLLSQYERDLFYISFPFKVSMEEVFGFGTYGQHWIIEEYDGASRAANGYWQESGPNWKFVFNRKNKFFEPGTGYIIALDLDEMGESADIWANTDQVELYFPSYGTMDNITSSTATYEIPAHECTINRSGESNGHGGTLGPDYDRRVKDSHWNVLGVPTYVNPDAPNFANTDWTTSATETSVGPNFLYEWNMDNNTVTAVSASDYTYHAMHAYLVQYCGDVKWTSSVSVKPSGPAPRRNPAYRGEYEFRLELQQNDVTVDQTFVKLSDNEAVTTGFEFNYDLSKEFNASKSNIYTLIGTEQAAGNVLPLTKQTTVVPVGVKIKKDGDYTFSMPDGTEGIGITLIDNETGIRTSLSALDYTVNLSAGTYDNRFMLEISPIRPISTDLESISDEGLEIRGARKVLIDGLLYIVKDGKMFDAQGRQVK